MIYLTPLTYFSLFKQKYTILIQLLRIQHFLSYGNFFLIKCIFI